MPGQTTDSGSQDVTLQEPVQSPGALAMPLGLENPDVLPAGVSGDKPLIVQPRTLTSAQPPLRSGIVVSLPQSTFQQAALANQSGAQANLIPLIAFPVLGRSGPFPSWAATVQLGGLSNVLVRGSYRDLRMTPGWRGLALQYTSVSTSVTVVDNRSGMVYQFGAGPKTVLIPLFMLVEIFDLTIKSGGAAFGAGATALLTTEEQVPYQFT